MADINRYSNRTNPPASGFETPSKSHKCCPKAKQDLGSGQKANVRRKRIVPGIMGLQVGGFETSRAFPALHLRGTESMVEQVSGLAQP
ncbi:hypothetical protein [Paracoccus fontiphilus]|uniref:Uncharacterized protein n=1 Tax=Paracoccus fontiphilus TaxID=1815556 RepID=A0ABV7IG76_9RHOB|nr:hypothetical protein [Paracoccus fontiphilus]